MKQTRSGILWAIFLLVAGLFLLLNNLGVMGEVGSLVWGAFFAVAGLAFMVWFFADRQRWWRAIPGFALLGSGAMLLAERQKIPLGDWKQAVVLLALALGFWAVALARRDHWWAVMPAGVLTVLGLLEGWRRQLETAGTWDAVFFLGLGLVFMLLYAVRFGQEDTRWAGIPAGAMLLLGVSTLVPTLKPSQLVGNWWPILLVLAGVVGLIFGFILRRPVGVLPPPHEDMDATLPAAGTSVTEHLPPAPRPVVKPVEPTAPKPGLIEPVDIYKLLEDQPKEEPPAPSEKP